MLQVLCCVWHYLSAGRQWWNRCSGKRRFCTETFTHSFICVWFIHSFIHQSIHSFIHSAFFLPNLFYILSLTPVSCIITFSEVCPSFVLSFIHPFICSFCFLQNLGPYLSPSAWKITFSEGCHSFVHSSIHFVFYQVWAYSFLPHAGKIKIFLRSIF